MHLRTRLGILGEGVPPGSPNPDLISDQKMSFSTTVFRSGLQAEIMSSLLRLERKQKNSSNPCRIRIFFFLSYSFRIETIDTFISSRSSLKNHTRFQTKMGKLYTCFQTKTAQKPDPMGRHMYIPQKLI